MTMPAAEGERVLVLLPDRDSPPKRDHSALFAPAARAMVKHLAPAEVETVEIPVPVVDADTLTIAGPAKQRGFEEAARAALEAIERRPWTRIVFLCHGWATGLQLGFRSRKQRGLDAEHMDRLVSAVASCAPRSVTLFACSAGDAPGSGKHDAGGGSGSLAWELAGAAGVPVLAHWTAGHATRNPDLIHFAPTDARGTARGEVVARRGSPAYQRAAALLTGTKPSGRLPPVGHARPAWASLALCTTLGDVRALLAAEPAS